MVIKPKKTIPEDLGDKKIQKVWDDKTGKFIDYESYAAVGKQFFDTIKSNTNISSEFEKFHDTSWFEKYMLNCYQFSAAKDMTETKALQELAIKAKGFEDFRKQAYEEVTSINRDVWLRVEMDSCIRGAVMGESWRSLEQSKDVYPYWQYKTEEDDRVREEHEALDNLVFKIGDPDGDDVFPPCDWNCRCHSEPLDDSDLTEQDLEVSEGKDYLTGKDENGKDYVDPDFRFNPGKQGPMTNDSDYFQVLPSANKSDYESFDFE